MFDHLSRVLGALTICCCFTAGCQSQPTTQKQEPPPRDVSLPLANGAEPSGSRSGPASLLEPRGQRSGATQGSQLLLANFAGRAVVVLADDTKAAISIIDPSSQQIVATRSLDCAPGQMVLDQGGDLHVVLPRCAKLASYRLVSGAGERPELSELRSAQTKDEPVALVLAKDERSLLVVSAWSQALQRFELPRLTKDKAVELPRDPRSVSISSDGSRAIVAHGSGGILSDVDLASGRVEQHSLNTIRRQRIFRPRHKIPHFDHVLFNTVKSVMQQSKPRPHRHRHPPRPRASSTKLFAGQGFASIAVQDRVFVPQALSNPGGPQEIAVGYGTAIDNFPASLQDLAVYDVSARSSNREAQFAIISGWSTSNKNVCRLPRAVAHDPQRDGLLVACIGSDRVIEYDALARDPARTEMAQWRVPRGPSALAVDASERRAYVWSSFARQLSVLQLGPAAVERYNEHSPQASVLRERATAELEVLASLDVTAELTPEQLSLLAGQALFHSANNPALSKDGRACASCHPAGRDDGLSWRTAGKLASRQTVMLDGRIADTAPYGWMGEHRTLVEHINNTITQQLSGTGLEPEDLSRLVNFVAHLPGPPQAEHALSSRERRGKELYHDKSVGCNNCHRADGRVDGRQHALLGGSGGAETSEQSLKLKVVARRDTPSLRFVAGSAPYFHDGRFLGLEDMLLHTQGAMGQRRALDERERQDLVAYLRTL